MHDQYFTPSNLAEIAVGAIRLRKVDVVADFAAGHGDLLIAAKSRWRNSVTIGCDIDPDCVRALRANSSVSLSVKCDFLSRNSRNRSGSLRDREGAIDVVVLNPPFSGIGGASVKVWAGSHFISCSKAMAFVYTSLSYLRNGGELVAILPASCLTSVKDAAIRKVCADISSQTLIRSFSARAFAGCVASTNVIKYRRGSSFACEIDAGHDRRCTDAISAISVRLIRGCTPVFRAENGLAGSEYPFIHSTDIVGPEVHEYERGVRSTTRVVRGPVVLLTRVGSPASKKCALYDCEQAIAISDCVIALECDSIQAAEIVRDRILANWDDLSAEYGGTCAPYITIENLSSFLVSVGVQPN